MIFINDNVPVGARGMERYFNHVTNGIIEHFGKNVVNFSARERDYEPATHIRAKRFKGSEQFNFHDLQATWHIHFKRPDLVFSAWFTTLKVCVPQVIVVYDAIYEKFPHYHSWQQTPLRNLYRERRKSLEQATKIIAISQSTANDFLAIYPQIAADKISVIHLGVDDSFFQDTVTPPISIQKPYLLFVGFRTGHKNFIRLLTAFGQSNLAQKYDLHVISSAPFNSAELEVMRQYHLSNAVKLHGHVTEAELRAAYANAIAFIYPSEYEGFGLPILEAMASGTIVLTSNLSSMPEIGGDIALYADPFDVASLADGLQRTVGLSSNERQQRMTQGIQWARSFTWNRCQEQTVHLLENLLQQTQL